MQRKHYLTSDWQQRRIFAGSTMLRQQRIGQLIVWLCFVVMLMALVLPLSGCQTQPIQPCEPPKIPKPPALSQQIPSETYSEQWRKLAEQSRLKLIGTPRTP